MTKKPIDTGGIAIVRPALSVRGFISGNVSLSTMSKGSPFSCTDLQNKETCVMIQQQMGWIATYHFINLNVNIRFLVGSSLILHEKVRQLIYRSKEDFGEHWFRTHVFHFTILCKSLWHCFSPQFSPQKPVHFLFCWSVSAATRNYWVYFFKIEVKL